MAELISERIARNASELKLLGLAESADEPINRAEEAKLGYREFLDLVLESERGVLEGRRYASRLKLSALPHHKTLEEFDACFQPELDPKRLAELRSLRFIERRVSSLDPGPARSWEDTSGGAPGDGGTQGRLPRALRDAGRPRPRAAPGRPAGNLRAKLAHFQRPHVFICDDVGYLPLERTDANRFFQLINRRYTRSSMIVTSNKRASEWAELFGDEVLAAAILDRLLHDAEVLTINGPSWRLRGHGDILGEGAQPAEIHPNGPTDPPRRPRRGPQKGSDAAA